MTDIEGTRLATILASVKVDLGITSTAYDSRLTQYIQAGAGDMERQGADLSTETAETNQLLVSWASWQWRTRDTREGMPRALRFSLNNFIFSQKMKKEAKHGIRNRHDNRAGQSQGCRS